MKEWLRIAVMGCIGLALIGGAVVAGLIVGRGINDGTITSASSEGQQVGPDGETPGLRTGTSPSFKPSMAPSKNPTGGPSIIPSAIPSLLPSVAPSVISSDHPSSIPSTLPSESPSSLPSVNPTNTNFPTTSPGPTLSNAPSIAPSSVPTLNPTESLSPTASLAPTSFPTVSLEPTVSKAPSRVPTESPTRSFSPTFFDVDSSRTFRIKLHWEADYFWQEEEKETFWCMDCTSCDELNFSEFPEDHKCKDANCQDGDQLWLRDCDRRGATMQTRNVNDGVMLEFVGQNTCVTRVRRDFLNVQTCNETLITQKWKPISSELPFELIPRYEKRSEDGEAFCITQHHHPKGVCQPSIVFATKSFAIERSTHNRYCFSKDYEILGMKRCTLAQQDHTSLFGLYPLLE